MGTYSRKEAASLGMLLGSAYEHLKDLPSKPPYPPAALSDLPDLKISGYLLLPSYQALSTQEGHAHIGRSVFCGLLACRVTDDQYHYFVALPELWDPSVRLTGVPSALTEHPDSTAGEVSLEYFTAYRHLDFAEGETMGDAACPAYEGIAEFLKRRPVSSLTVIGHGFGGVLGAYLLFDLSTRTEFSFALKGCLFGCLKPGDSAFAGTFDRLVDDYAVYQYERDIYREFPLGPDFAPLPRQFILSGTNVQAIVQDTVEANHHTVCYAAMLHARSKPSLIDWQDSLRRQDGKIEYLLGLKPIWWSLAKKAINRDNFDLAKSVFDELSDGGSKHAESILKIVIPLLYGSIGMAAPFAIHTIMPQAPVPYYLSPPIPPRGEGGPTVRAADDAAVPVFNIYASAPAAGRPDDVRAQVDDSATKDAIDDLRAIAGKQCLIGRDVITKLHSELAAYTESIDGVIGRVDAVASVYKDNPTDHVPPIHLLRMLGDPILQAADAADSFKRGIEKDLNGTTGNMLVACDANANLLNDGITRLDKLIPKPG